MVQPWHPWYLVQVWALLVAMWLLTPFGDGGWRQAYAGAATVGAGGGALIGELEGPEIITDPARFPRSLSESPALAELVKAGKLPPVRERLGDDPLVVKPLHEIGQYGGTWRRGFTGPADTSAGQRVGGPFAG